ncbi:hypothetical protein CALVIDRAFT_598860 [Calocera viscosa TUFC12733]|uniref:FUN14-domain-containing protein n=1 Tax=Calocera viscosa (strain TUFC12733) TaxID=1330018 RepID=A0A167LL30_CALVF|nr:hypothetical protein CALVIDRAFT_598860 [Calocera viscosa TUFC12733]
MFATSFLRAAFHPAGFTRFTTARSAWAASARQFRPSPSRAYTSAALRPGTRHAYGSSGRWSLPLVGLGIVAAVPVVMGTSAFARGPVLCEGPPVVPPPGNLPPPAEPASIANVYELSFGAVCGICAGVFVKKGAKMLAFLLGGIFVLLQYFNSLSLISINWDKMSDRYNNLFTSTGPDGVQHAPTPASLWNWLVSFLLADFQQRASFVAGLMLGLRIG